jgi:V8-like Glu-specific endopeptidase
MSIKSTLAILPFAGTCRRRIVAVGTRRRRSEQGYAGLGSAGSITVETSGAGRPSRLVLGKKHFTKTETAARAGAAPVVAGTDSSYRAPTARHIRERRVFPAPATGARAGRLPHRAKPEELAMQAVECSFQDQAVLTELRKLLAALYPTEADQRRLATEAKLVTGAIPLGSSAFNNWHHILQHARHNRGVEALVSLALDEFPENEQLQLLRCGQTPPVLDGGSFAWQGPANGRELLEKAVSGRAALVPVAHLALALARARAVVKIVRPDGGTGTGFLIPGDRLLTNHHVLPSAEIAAESAAVFNYQKGASGCDEPAESLGLEPGRVFLTSEADDFTVVGIPAGTEARWGSIELRRSTVMKGELVNIIQHPGGGPKQMGLSFEVVAFVGAGRLQYLSDTQPGSSGAPVFDSRWNVVALHHSGGWLMEPGSSDKRVYYRNQGIHVDRIIERLDAAGGAS